METLAHRAAAVHRGAELLEVGLRVGVELAASPSASTPGLNIEKYTSNTVSNTLVVAVVLHQRRAERGLERVAVVERHVLDRAHRVEVLGHRHRQPRGAQLVHEALEHVEHVGSAARRHGHRSRGRAVHRVVELAPLHALDARAAVAGASTPSSLRALVMSVWYLSSTCSVSPMHLGRDLVAAEVHERARPVDRLRDRRRLLQVRRRSASRMSVLYTELETALTQNTVARYNFITPNLCNDMHDCGIAAGDTWLSRNCRRSWFAGLQVRRRHFP